MLVNTIRESLQRILSTPEPPETDRPLIEMGLDSLMAVEFGTELQQMLGDQFNVGPTMLFDHPTIDAISDYVLELATAAEPSGSSTGSQQPEKAAQVGQTTRERPERDDIAIIGMSCRFPGARNVSEFWQNLLNGVDAVCDIPNDRWDIDRFYSADRESGKMYTRSGGFLDDIAEFDAKFFNISPREACWIDPQHRMLLENSYRALEDAGMATAPLVDPNVGVFMGIMGSDYAFLPTLDDEQIIKGFQGAGLSHSAGVGRISYVFGFEGPSLAIDTASSSSLVAVYQAMRALQDGNCNLALAGGVNAILAPVNSLLMSNAGLLSPDGRCKSFSKSADGFGRGEGCGVVVLKRLGDAHRDGDRIMAVIRGGAVVHNGFSGGITSPNSKAQSRVIDAAIKDAALAPSQVQYLEAHGTGTEYGDPMELNAAVGIYGKGRGKDNPLLLGSVKANISHLEAAGGSSGLIKTVLAIHHGIIPRQIHIDEPSPHIPWNRMPVKIVTENTPWPKCERRTAGITALGLVGTNAHLVLSSPNESPSPDAPTRTPSEPDQRLLVASARCPNALRELRESYASFLEKYPDTDLDDFCFTLGAGRRHFEYRFAMPFDNRTQAIEMLREANVSNGKQDANGNGAAKNGSAQLMADKVAKAPPKLAWIFGGEDDHTLSTLRHLFSTHTVVAEFVKECDRRLQQQASANEETCGLEKLLEDSNCPDSMNQTLLFVLQAGLARLWTSWGIQADAACGLGVGQYTAACVAGGLDFLDALILVRERERLHRNPDNGQADWDAFEKTADQFNFYPPDLPLICSLTGTIVPVHRSLGGSYWREHASAAPRTDASIKALASIRCDAGLVLGSEMIHGSLLAQLEKGKINVFNAAVAFSKSKTPSLIATLAELYQSGCNPDFHSVYGGRPRQKLSLPTYPFQKKRYWITEISQFMETGETEERQCVHS